MTITLKDVAERAGVSRSAVSRTFTQGASVSEKTRRKVEKAAAELGYAPNALASGLRTGRTKLIGLVSNNFQNPVFLKVFDLFTRRLQDHGLRPLLVNLSDEADPQHSVRMLRQYSVDAVIVASSTLPPGFSRGFRDAGLPVVHAFGRPTGSPEVHMAGIDNVACGRMAAQTLLRRGYRNVAFLGGPEAATTTQDRLAGFMEEVSLCSGATARVSFANAYSYAAGETEMQRILANGSTSEAYFCGDDVIAIGALSAVRAAGRRVPEDAGIIGLNDMEMAAWSLINLTTIRQPIAEIITASVDLAVAASENPQRPPVEQLFQCEVVERGTLRPRTGA